MGTPKAGHRLALRPQANATERRCVTGLNRTWLQPRSAALKAHGRAAPAGIPKAGHRLALRPQANAKERRCATGLNRTCLQPWSAALRANERAAPAGTPKAGHRLVLRSVDLKTPLGPPASSGHITGGRWNGVTSVRSLPVFWYLESRISNPRCCGRAAGRHWNSQARTPALRRKSAVP